MITSVGISREEPREFLPFLASEFPSLRWKPREDPGDVEVPLSAWPRRDLDLYDFDSRMDRLEGDEPHALWLVAECDRDARRASEVLTRCQRLFMRRNPASDTAEFTRVLALHRARHDVSKPLVRADLNHALDCWQWVLRLEPEAPAELQYAALFHDVERLVTEAERRVEQHAKDHVAFKEAHARAGARIADAALGEAGVSAPVRARVAELISRHERPPGSEAERERRVLTDADALSFFSLNSGGYYDYFGPARTWEKVGYSLARLSPASRARLAGLRLRPEVAVMADELADVPWGAVEKPLRGL